MGGPVNHRRQLIRNQRAETPGPRFRPSPGVPQGVASSDRVCVDLQPSLPRRVRPADFWWEEAEVRPVWHSDGPSLPCGDSPRAGRRRHLRGPGVATVTPQS